MLSRIITSKSYRTCYHGTSFLARKIRNGVIRKLTKKVKKLVANKKLFAKN
jgi:hypothetical protein